MIYTTDHKWKLFKYRGEIPPKVQEEYPASYGDYFFKYRNVWYAIGEFSRTVHPELFDENCPIIPHGSAGCSAFHSVLIEISNDGDSYRVCTVKF